MKRLAFIALITLTTLLQAATFTIEKKVRVVSSEPIYEKNRKHHKHCCDEPPARRIVNNHEIRYDADRHSAENFRHLKRHHIHRKQKITGYRNIGYYQGRKIVKKSRRPLRRIPLHITVSY